MEAEQITAAAVAPVAKRRLVGVPRVREALGITPSEAERWIGDGRIPTAARRVYSIYGARREGTVHDPALFDALRALVPQWRADHEAATAANRAVQCLRDRQAGRLRDWARAAYPGSNAVECQDGLWLRVPFRLDVQMGTVASKVLTSALLPVPSDLLSLAAQEEIAAPARREARTALRSWLVGQVDALAVTLRGEVAEAVARVVEMAEQTGASEMFLKFLQQALNGGGEVLAANLPDHLVGRAELTLQTFETRRRRWDLLIRCGFDNFPALFPTARMLGRKLTLYVGPTNSGKTHAAMDRLAAAGSGVYAAPLRLMALEAQERLETERGVRCSLITGEERCVIDGARHVSCTVEMSDLGAPVEVALIDEVQMLMDPDRGWAWSTAIAGLPAREVMMTGSVDCIPYVERLAKELQEPLEIKHFGRMTPLMPLSGSVDMKEIAAGDAVVAFSRRAVLDMKDSLEAAGHRVAVVYGALGPEVRRIEAARFRSGEAQVLVATDAIGMGLNLPCKRVIFSAVNKFDGSEDRLLKPQEYRQIAGRAGRYGLADAGYAGVMTPLPRAALIQALQETPELPNPDLVRLRVMPTWHAVNEISRQSDESKLWKILHDFVDLFTGEKRWFVAADMATRYEIAAIVDQTLLPLRERFSYLGAPIDKVEVQGEFLRRWSLQHGLGRTITCPMAPRKDVPETHSQLETVEQWSKNCTLYLWLTHHWPAVYTEQEKAREGLRQATTLITTALKARRLKKTCASCGRPLAPGFVYRNCDRCHRFIRW